MNKLLRFCLIAFATFLISANDIYAQSGSWRGKLTLGQMELPLVFNFSQSVTGEVQCTIDSPSQGAKGVPTEVLLCTPDSISLTINAIGASYNGRKTSDIIKGHFKQQGYEFPLDLAPEIPLEERRPQTPKPPFPYNIIDTTFTAPDGAVMSATLTLPTNTRNKKVPAVIMVTGSGPQNRDEELLDHKPFAVIADYLARKGIASLRYDDRGTGKSTGNFLTATTFTLKDDAMSAIEFMRSVTGIGKIGVLGHSEGGTISFMLGAENKADLIISLAGMAISGKETLMRQNNHSLDLLNLSDEEKASSMNLIEQVFDAIIKQTGKGMSPTIYINALIANSSSHVPQQVITSIQMTQKIRTPWFDTFLTLNPREYLGKVKCPMLAINGEKDTQVYPDNLKVIQEFVPHAKTELMPELNHLMQHAVTGELSEYDNIRETISPEVLDIIVNFIKHL